MDLNEILQRLERSGGGRADLGVDEEAARAVAGCFEGLTRELSRITEMDEEEVMDALDRLRDALVSAWNVKTKDGSYAVEQAWMERLMDAIGVALQKRVSKKLKAAGATGEEPTSPNGQSPEDAILAERGILRSWESIVSSLSRSKWQEGGWKRLWEGKPYRDTRASEARERIDDLGRMREVYSGANELLDRQEAGSLPASEAFAPFRAVDPAGADGSDRASWEKRREEFNKLMKPLEERLSSRLRDLLGNRLLPVLRGAGKEGGARVEQALLDIKRYARLLGRPAVLQELSSEQEEAEELVRSHLTRLRDRFDSGAEDEEGAEDLGRNLPDVVRAISWAAQIAYKAGVAEEVLAALEEGSGAGGNAIEASELRKSAEKYKARKFDEWKEGNRKRVESIRLERSGSVMDIDLKSGEVRLHFNDELVRLLKETRQLRALGFRVPREIAQECDTARHFYRHGMILKQVANFYNDISRQMLECQKPMMLEDARRFEDILRSPLDSQGNRITWDNPTVRSHRLASLCSM